VGNVVKVYYIEVFLLVVAVGNKESCAASGCKKSSPYLQPMIYCDLQAQLNKLSQYKNFP